MYVFKEFMATYMYYTYMINGYHLPPLVCKLPESRKHICLAHHFKNLAALTGTE